MWSNDRPTTPGFYWCHQRGKTRIVHIWCYKNGTELFTNEDGGASIKDTLYDGTQWMAAVIPPNPQDQNESAQLAPKAVAYLDLGVGGYMDIGTDLTDEELATLPKGRHMLGVIGTYGVDGYVPAQPAPSIPVDAIGKMLTQLMDIAVANGADGRSMPDEYVEVAAWLCGMPTQNVPNVSENYFGMTLHDTIEVMENKL